MTDEERLRRNSDPIVNELKKKISNCNSDNSYVFISYKSDDWETVLTKIVYKLVTEFHLNIYYDGSFDLHNDSWIDQFPENMDSYKCRGVLAFLDDAYAASYATLMELMHSQTFNASLSDSDCETGLPIIPVNLGDLTNIGGALGDEDTGLGSGSSNLNADAERELFENDYQEVSSYPSTKQGFKIYKSGKRFQKKHCSKMVRELLASKGYNTNMYSDNKEFYENLVATIKNTCGESVFGKAPDADQTIDATISGDIDGTAGTKGVTVNETPDTTEAGHDAVTASDVSRPAGAIKASDKEISYILYGKEYTHNQANMMLNVFDKVLKRHPDAVDMLLEDPDDSRIRCVSAVNYELPENKSLIKTSYFKAGAYLEIGRGIFVGTALNFSDKLRQISTLLTFCGEDFSVLQSEQIALPENVKVKSSARGEEHYSVYGRQYSGNQTQMMTDVLRFIVEKHFDKREELAGLLCIKLAPLESLRLAGISYFRPGEEFTYQGVVYSVGASFSRTEKLKQIAKAISICGEDIGQFEIEGLSEVYSKLNGSRTSGRKRDFLYE